MKKAAYRTYVLSKGERKNVSFLYLRSLMSRVGKKNYDSRRRDQTTQAIRGRKEHSQGGHHGYGWNKKSKKQARGRKRILFPIFTIVVCVLRVWNGSWEFNMRNEKISSGKCLLMFISSLSVIITESWLLSFSFAFPPKKMREKRAFSLCWNNSKDNSVCFSHHLW